MGTDTANSNVKAFNFDETLLFEGDFELTAGGSQSIVFPLPESNYGSIIVESDREGVVFQNMIRRKDEYVLTFPGK